MTEARAHRTFFPLAAAHGAVSIGVWSMLPGLAPPALWHAHEMVFGYTLAVVAGFLLTRASRGAIVVAASAWLAARLAWALPDAPMLLQGALSVISTGIVVALASRGFLRGVKRGQNAVFPVLLSVVLLCDLAAQLGRAAAAPGVALAAVLAAVVLVVILIVVMGGRITGAALSGLAQRAGSPRIPPQPRLERVLVGALAGMALADAAGAEILSAAFASVAAGGIAIRMAAWRAAFRLAGADLRSLAVAQCFVGVGLAGMAGVPFGLPWPDSAPLHLVTVGGIGIATVTMMLKTHAQRERRPSPSGAVAAAAALLAAAAVTRAAGYLEPATVYPISGAVWILAMTVCLVALTRSGTGGGSGA